MTRPNQSTSVRLTFHGRNLGDRFAAFASERIGRFKLDGKVISSSSTLVTIEAAGHHALVDMLEVCCSVGPLESVVRTIETEQI